MTAEEAEALGRLVASASALEAICHLVASGMMGVDQRVGEAITAPMGDRALVDLMRRLVPLVVTGDAAQSEFLAVLKSIDSAVERRNAFVHSTYGVSDADGTTARRRLGRAGRNERGRGVEPPTVEIAPLDEATSEITRVSVALIKCAESANVLTVYETDPV